MINNELGLLLAQYLVNKKDIPIKSILLLCRSSSIALMSKSNGFECLIIEDITFSSSKGFIYNLFVNLRNIWLCWYKILKCKRWHIYMSHDETLFRHILKIYPLTKSRVCYEDGSLSFFSPLEKKAYTPLGHYANEYKISNISILKKKIKNPVLFYDKSFDLYYQFSKNSFPHISLDKKELLSNLFYFYPISDDGRKLFNSQSGNVKIAIFAPTRGDVLFGLSDNYFNEYIQPFLKSIVNKYSLILIKLHPRLVHTTWHKLFESASTEISKDKIKIIDYPLEPIFYRHHCMIDFFSDISSLFCYSIEMNVCSFSTLQWLINRNILTNTGNISFSRIIETDIPDFIKQSSLFSFYE